MIGFNHSAFEKEKKKRIHQRQSDVDNIDRASY